MGDPSRGQKPDAANAGESSRGTVLLVDDSEDCRIIYSAALAFAG